MIEQRFKRGDLVMATTDAYMWEKRGLRAVATIKINDVCIVTMTVTAIIGQPERVEVLHKEETGWISVDRLIVVQAGRC